VNIHPLLSLLLAPMNNANK